MADWHGSARTNYFRVKDRAKFEECINGIEGLEVIEDGDGRVGLLSEGEFGGWPNGVYDEETDELEEIDLCEIVSGHLQDGSVAVFMEVGAEKLRYLTGVAVAINLKGESKVIQLGDIYELAKQLGDEVTLAEY